MIDIRIGDCRQLIHSLTDESIDCVMTSPPYWGLRDYGHHDQIGLEATPEEYLKTMLDFFDDVKLKLKAEGNCFVNLGDTYSSNTKGDNRAPEEFTGIVGALRNGAQSANGKKKVNCGIPEKCLCMIPQRFAWGMIERGWILRNEIIWSKPNHMPESVTDRLTKAHEVIYHFVKQQKYYYNLDAIREPWVNRENDIKRAKNKELRYHGKFGGGYDVANSRKDHLNATATGQPIGNPDKGKNPGDVWSITTQPYPESHFAVFPLELVRRPILAGCPVGGTVLDPFGGSGTVGEFCRHNDRNAILLELNHEYIKLIKERSMADTLYISDFVDGAHG